VRSLSAKLLSTLVSLSLPSCPIPAGATAVVPASGKAAVDLGAHFAPPSDLGTVVESYRSPRADAPVVIHIQDLHANYEVQTHIAKLLEFYDARFAQVPYKVAVEGAEGPVWIAEMGKLPEKAFKTAICDRLLQAAELTGTEAFAIVNGKPDILWGVENERYHKTNLDLFRSTFAGKEALATALDRLENEIRPVRKKYNSPGIAAMFHDLDLLKRYVREQVAPDEVRKETPELETALGRIQVALDAAGVAYDKENLAKTISASLDFFVVALLRDRYLAGNTLAMMRRENINRSILVTGGFHTPGLTRLFKEKGISYVVVAPAITLAADSRPLYNLRLLGHHASVPELMAAPAMLSDELNGAGILKSSTGFFTSRWAQITGSLQGALDAFAQAGIRGPELAYAVETGSPPPPPNVMFSKFENPSRRSAGSPPPRQTIGRGIAPYRVYSVIGLTGLALAGVGLRAGLPTAEWPLVSVLGGLALITVAAFALTLPRDIWPPQGDAATSAASSDRPAGALPEPSRFQTLFEKELPLLPQVKLAASVIWNDPLIQALSPTMEAVKAENHIGVRIVLQATRTGEHAASFTILRVRRGLQPSYYRLRIDLPERVVPEIRNLDGRGLDEQARQQLLLLRPELERYGRQVQADATRRTMRFIDPFWKIFKAELQLDDARHQSHLYEALTGRDARGNPLRPGDLGYVFVDEIGVPHAVMIDDFIRTGQLRQSEVDRIWLAFMRAINRAHAQTPGWTPLTLDVKDEQFTRDLALVKGYVREHEQIHVKILRHPDAILEFRNILNSTVPTDLFGPAPDAGRSAVPSNWYLEEMLVQLIQPASALHDPQSVAAALREAGVVLTDEQLTAIRALAKKILIQGPRKLSPVTRITETTSAPALDLFDIVDNSTVEPEIKAAFSQLLQDVDVRRMRVGVSSPAEKTLQLTIANPFSSEGQFIFTAKSVAPYVELTMVHENVVTHQRFGRFRDPKHLTVELSGTAQAIERLLDQAKRTDAWEKWRTAPSAVEVASELLAGTELRRAADIDVLAAAIQGDHHTLIEQVALVTNMSEPEAAQFIQRGQAVYQKRLNAAKKTRTRGDSGFILDETLVALGAAAAVTTGVAAVATGWVGVSIFAFVAAGGLAVYLFRGQIRSLYESRRAAAERMRNLAAKMAAGAPPVPIHFGRISEAAAEAAARNQISPDEVKRQRVEVAFGWSA
jgi:hypothetical protein